MRLFLLNLLRLIPYRNKWGLSLDSILKDRHYRKHRSEYCLCGGKFKLATFGNGRQELICSQCGYLADED